MPTLGEEARVKLPGGSRDLTRASSGMLDVSTEDELAFSAWYLHEAILERAKRENAPQHMHEGIVGYRWEGHVNNVVHTLWPALSRDPQQEPDRTAKVRLNTWLRATRNMVCLNQGNQITPSTWWVRAVFSETPPTRTLAVPPHPAETKLTPAEAGETRQPEDVATQFICTWPGCDVPPFTAKATRTAHHFATHRTAEDYLTAALTRLDRFAKIPEIHLAAEQDGFPGTMDVTRRTLDAMTAEGKLRFAEVGTPGPGGPAFTYALAQQAPPPAKPVPAENTGGAYECREPGCTYPAFANADHRRRHEDTIHPDMTSRRYACKFRRCRDRFYNMPGLAIHMGTAHNLRKNTPQFRDLLERAVAEAENKPAPAAPPAEAPPPNAPAVSAAGDPVAAIQAVVSENIQLREENRVLKAENTDLRGRLDAITEAVTRVRG